MCVRHHDGLQFRVTVARGFTLIELLIVVAIIAILAAIAVPNFLEAQTRAKVSRAKADMRTLTTALEAYAVDHNAYPPHLVFPGGVETEVPYPTRYQYLTTPVAFLTSTEVARDPFIVKPETGQGGSGFYMSWTNLQSFTLRPTPHPTEPARPTHKWLLRSRGPDTVNEPNAVRNSWLVGGIALGPSMIYDPTNGTVSQGDICRTARFTPP
jgi:prepilin-type N-terminal cleavage/methylation domain-containing protein